ncbi:COG3293: Transposase and inactivated derivatives [Richelia intracellularis]|nr:COG3293: Transposase and inactivated derivatives [Richelia intracellularis]
MAGPFEGLSNLEWSLFEDIFPKPTEKRERGMPHSSFPSVLNTLLYILITGCAWSDVPKGEIWASKSSAHRWLKGWQLDGTLEALQARILRIGQEKGLINWSYGAVDGSFSPRKPLKVLAAEKAYDCKDKRAGLPRRGIRPQWPKRVWKTKKNKGRPIKVSVPGFQQERCFPWLKKNIVVLFVVIWERISACFDAFLSLATIHIWINKTILVGYNHKFLLCEREKSTCKLHSAMWN